MIKELEDQTKLTKNQYKIVLTGAILNMLNFFDFYLIAYVLAFAIGTWHISYFQSALILLGGGMGSLIGAPLWGWVADRIGRRNVLIATLVNFSLASAVMAITPDQGGWMFLTAFQFILGLGLGGLHSVVIPLVQEFVPTKRRGWAGGLVVTGLPLGKMLAAASGAALAPVLGWRGLFAIGTLPIIAILLILAWMPESPRWLVRMQRQDAARRSLAWALAADPNKLEMPRSADGARRVPWHELFRYRRSLIVSCTTQLAFLTGTAGVGLWAATLLVLLLKVTPAQASFLMIFAAGFGFVGRFFWSYLSDVIGRRPSGAIVSFGAALTLAAAAHFNAVMIGPVSVFWVLLTLHTFFGDGGNAVVQPYSAEVWPMSLRASGMGFAYGIGSLSKIVGPLGLALIVGASDLVRPKAALSNVEPALLFLAAWFAIAGIVFLFAAETKGRSIEQIDTALRGGETKVARPVAVSVADGQNAVSPMP